MHAPASLSIVFSRCGRDFASRKLREEMSEYTTRLAAGITDREFAVAFRTFPMQSTGMFHLTFSMHEHPSATMLESL